ENAKCLSINQIINVLDMAKVTKVGKPAGFEKSSNSVPTGLQAYRSKNSLLLIQAMLAEVKDVYFNRKTNYASMVNAIDNSKKISDEIAKKFDAVDKEITALNTPLFDAINTDAKTVKPLYNALKELSILFAVDVTSILSVTVVPTDNDGD
ncbi:imelysin family protein, partial [Tenacibaculum finnmarkense]